jgi:DNA-binding cell septation regulator SpoVG
MREFGHPVGGDVRSDIYELARNIFNRVETKRAVRAKEFAMENNPEQVVVHEVDLRQGDERLRIAMTEEAARPPFEWFIEITSDIGESDYFKHYLVRQDDVVLAQRKVLTPIDQAEADTVIHDLKLAQTWL